MRANCRELAKEELDGMQQWEALPLLKAAMLQANEDAVLKLREEARQHVRS